MKTICDYYDLYLKTCFAIGKCVSTVQKNMSINCKLDPCLYLSNPKLNWDSMLRMTGAALELVTDIGMHKYIEGTMRGEVFYLVCYFDIGKCVSTVQKNVYKFQIRSVSLSQ